MEEVSYESVANDLAQGYKFETKKYLSEGWDLGLKSIGWILLYGLIVYLMNFVSGLIPIAGGLIYSVFLAPVMAAGLILFLHNKSITNESDFGLVFNGFSNNTGNIVGVNLLAGLIMIGVLIPGMILFFTSINLSDFARIPQLQSDPKAMIELLLSIISDAGISMVIMFLGVLILSVFLVFANFFVVLGNVSASKAITLSFKVAKPNFFPILGFFLLLGLINLGGVLVLGLGLIVTYPVTLAATYIMFKHVVYSKIDEESLNLGSEDILDA